jgi:hypothetical protein
MGHTAYGDAIVGRHNAACLIMFGLVSDGSLILRETVKPESWLDDEHATTSTGRLTVQRLLRCWAIETRTESRRLKSRGDAHERNEDPYDHCGFDRCR